MKTRGAVVRESPGQWEIVELDVEEPRQGEVLLEMVASGLCHSDDHICTGDLPPGILPMAGGHEGAGVIAAVGPNTLGWEVGDHVIMSFLPGCGRCRWCASGMQNLCDMGANVLTGCRADGSYRMSFEGQPVGQTAGISTFCEKTLVDVASCVKVDKDVPLEKVCLLGCGVGTGWGSSVNAAEVKPGHTVIVMGIGGIGINAVQGAAHAGATHVIAVDPIEFKREMAQKMGATHTFADINEAAEFARSVTNGQGADSAVVTTGVLKTEHVSEAFSAIRKAGTVVVTGIGAVTEKVEVPAFELTLYQKRIQGALFGASSPSRDIPWMLGMYQSGQLKLDELITSTYTLDQINQGYADMHAGKNIRGVIIY
ncbi:MAG: NDMA-dependent alcohol dehydrogenase [Acidimicrobiia bacterium]|nr:NDMA-dependent alcohol dehydrogenase [Acidimicrobiia bacterium]